VADEPKQWEYRILTVGGVFGTKDEQVEAILNEMGEDGWEAVNLFCQTNSAKITIVTKRPLERSERRWRSMP
jgi:hypothetical protein